MSLKLQFREHLNVLINRKRWVKGTWENWALRIYSLENIQVLVWLYTFSKASFSKEMFTVHLQKMASKNKNTLENKKGKFTLSKKKGSSFWVERKSKTEKQCCNNKIRCSSWYVIPGMPAMAQAWPLTGVTESGFFSPLCSWAPILRMCPSWPSSSNQIS